MRFINQFFTDFARQPKHLFFRKYFLLPVIIFMGWVTIGTAYEQFYDISDLTEINGEIASIDEVITRVIDKQAYKKKKKEVRLYLKGHPKYFRLTDTFDYAPIVEKLKIGEVVQVYIEKPYLVYLGMGRRTDIYQLEYQGKTLFQLSDKKQKATGSIFLGAVFTLALSAFYLYHKKKEKRRVTKAVT